MAVQGCLLLRQLIKLASQCCPTRQRVFCLQALAEAMHVAPWQQCLLDEVLHAIMRQCAAAVSMVLCGTTSQAVLVVEQCEEMQMAGR